MGRRRDYTILKWVEECIAIGMLDSQIARKMMAEKEVKSTKSAYEYINITYRNLGPILAADREKNIKKALIQIALDRRRAIGANDRREAGKCTDRFMKLVGIGVERTEVGVPGAFSELEKRVNEILGNASPANAGSIPPIEDDEEESEL
jgi:hypothetical protein